MWVACPVSDYNCILQKPPWLLYSISDQTSTFIGAPRWLLLIHYAKILNVKNTVVESHDFYNDADGVTHLRIKARPKSMAQGRLSLLRGDAVPAMIPCRRSPKVWRALDWGGLLVKFEYCPGSAERIPGTA